MFGFQGRTRLDQQHAIDETRTMAIQQLLLIEWRGQAENDSNTRLTLTEMLEEADACGRVLQKGCLLSAEDFEAVLKIRTFLRGRRAAAVRAASMPPPPRPRPGVTAACRLIRSR